MEKDILNIAVVNFNAIWGDKEKNLKRIKGYIECAAKRGAELIVFPEMSLTGYDYVKPTNEKSMQERLSESVTGGSVHRIEKVAKVYGVYVMMGLPERGEDEKVYNSVVLIGPSGIIGSYRKIHLALDEPCWATTGDEPMLLESPWGPIGIAICYDVYSFPELIRYYAAKGARLVINSTAYAKSRGAAKGNMTLEAAVVVNGIFIATANLCGMDAHNDFWGGSSIIGPSKKMQDIHYYAGYSFGEEKGMEEGLYIETIDLSLAHRSIYTTNTKLGRPDFRSELYARLYKEL